MKKVLFVGIQRFYLQGMLRNLANDKGELIEDFLANNQREAVEIAEENPYLDLVIFMGYVATGELSECPFTANVKISTELRKILSPEVIMVAATGHDEADKKLLENGCSVWLSFDKVLQWLRTYLGK